MLNSLKLPSTMARSPVEAVADDGGERMARMRPTASRSTAKRSWEREKLAFVCSLYSNSIDYEIFSQARPGSVCPYFLLLNSQVLDRTNNVHTVSSDQAWSLHSPRYTLGATSRMVQSHHSSSDSTRSHLASSKQWSIPLPSPRHAATNLESITHCSCVYLQQSFYDFRYDDEDTVMNEIDEFYSYVEMPQVAENLKAWQGSFRGGMLRDFHELNSFVVQSRSS